jgi:hypothetical protein
MSIIRPKQRAILRRESMVRSCGSRCSGRPTTPQIMPRARSRKLGRPARPVKLFHWRNEFFEHRKRVPQLPVVNAALYRGNMKSRAVSSPSRIAR